MYVRLRGMCVLNYFVNSPPHDAEREAELCSMIPIKTVRPKKLSMSSNSPSVLSGENGSFISA